MQRKEIIFKRLEEDLTVTSGASASGRGGRGGNRLERQVEGFYSSASPVQIRSHFRLFPDATHIGFWLMASGKMLWGQRRPRTMMGSLCLCSL